MMRRDLDRLRTHTFDVLVVGCGIHGLGALHHLPAGRVVSRGRAIQDYPGLRRQGLTGAAVWYDYVMTEPDRLTFAFALAAVEHGALLANHVEATALGRDNARVT